MSLLDDIRDLPSSKWAIAINQVAASRMKEIAPRARQFIFDSESSKQIGSFIRTCPDIIYDNLQFAVPPYDPVYVEWDIDACIDGIGRTTYDGDDWRVGFLFSNGIIYTMVNTRERPTAFASPMGYVERSYPNKLVQITNYGTDTDPSEMQKLLLGSSYHTYSPAQRKEFSDRFSMNYVGPKEFFDFALEKFSTAMFGEIRMFLTALLMLYQKQNVTIQDRPYERRISRGKLRTFMAHSTVTIHLSNEAEIRKAFQTGERGAPRRHEVRTHYAHRHGVKSCAHTWNKIEEAANEQWSCSHCGRLRWLKKSHLRGDGSKGFVVKKYEVKL
jgi:hypothetical protein